LTRYRRRPATINTIKIVNNGIINDLLVYFKDNLLGSYKYYITITKSYIIHTFPGRLTGLGKIFLLGIKRSSIDNKILPGGSLFLKNPAMVNPPHNP
jgi:hypothetical protein